jgi:hypothetical protein
MLDNTRILFRALQDCIYRESRSVSILIIVMVNEHTPLDSQFQGVTSLIAPFIEGR